MNNILMSHLYYGDPSEEFSLRLAKTLFDSGADALEIGIAYTDPVCDGKVFQHACKRVLLKKITPFDVFKGIKEIRRSGYHKPIYLQSYFAPIYKIGMQKFFRKAKETGVKGLIIPDLLLEEQEQMQKLCREFDLSVIQFATVYSSSERLRKICSFSADFIYCIALPGVTGDKAREKIKLIKLIETLKSYTDKKIYVGFGISSGKDVEQLIKAGADGVVVGTAIARVYERYIQQPEKSISQVATYIKTLKKYYNKEKR